MTPKILAGAIMVTFGIATSAFRSRLWWGRWSGLRLASTGARMMGLNVPFDRDNIIQLVDAVADVLEGVE